MEVGENKPIFRHTITIICRYLQCNYLCKSNKYNFAFTG